MSLYEENLRIVGDLGRQKEEKVYRWLQYLIGLASGVLAVLFAFQRRIPAGTPGTALRYAITALALGILLGSLRLYVEVWYVRAHLKALLEQANRQIDTMTFVPFSGNVATAPKHLMVCEYLCYLAFLTALVSLVVVAWTLPVTTAP